MSSAPLRPPNPATSPFIRGSRYVMLGLGFLYGGWQLKRLSRKEVVVQEREDAIRARRDSRLAREKEEALRVEMNQLAEEAGVPNRV